MAERHQTWETTPLVADDNAAEINDGDSTFGLCDMSDTTSLRSSILKYRQENGRTYHAYKDGAYVLPNDEDENKRLDLQHHLFYLTFDGNLHASPLTKKPHRIFDAGCGTGIWAIDFADQHPECEIVGVDLSPIQLSGIPPNVSFYVDDLEAAWDYSTKFDFIFARFLTGSIRNWPRFFEQSFEFLNPGGTIEMIDILYPLQSDDGTLKGDSALFKWSKMLLEAFTSIGAPMDSALKYKDQLEAAGFADVKVVKQKWPINTWPKDPKYKEIGAWTNRNALDALEALSLAVFTRPKGQGGLGWSSKELEVFLSDVRKDIVDLRIHSYWPIWSVYATKPE